MSGINIAAAGFFSLLGLFLVYRGFTKEQNKFFKYGDIVIGLFCFAPNFTALLLNFINR